MVEYSRATVIDIISTLIMSASPMAALFLLIIVYSID